MTDILNLPKWRVLSYTEEDVNTIEAEYTEHPKHCTSCSSDRIYKHGPKQIIYKDTPFRGLPTVIVAKLQRYRCRDCGTAFPQDVTGIKPDTRFTNRCIRYIRSQCLRDTFTRIAENVGCDHKTIRAIALDYIEEINSNYNPVLSGWVGIDETMIDGKQRFVVADIVNRRLVEMLPDREHATVSNYLWKHRNDPIEGFAMDMWRPYKKIINTVFPGVPIVVDKFHVVRMANQAMDGVRIHLAKDENKAVGKDWMRRKSLLRMRNKDLDEHGKYHVDMWLENNPKLNIAYNLKELFYCVYDQTTKEDAERVLDEWLNIIPSEMKKSTKDFKPLITASTNWREEILNYFDYPATNAFTEAMNGVAKVINRQGRGYGFDILRARILFNKLPMPQIPAFHVHHDVTDEEYKRIEEGFIRCLSCFKLHDSNVREVICDECWERLHPDDDFVKEILG